jgi:hypothetical protein
MAADQRHAQSSQAPNPPEGAQKDRLTARIFQDRSDDQLFFSGGMLFKVACHPFNFLTERPFQKASQRRVAREK